MHHRCSSTRPAGTVTSRIFKEFWEFIGLPFCGALRIGALTALRATVFARRPDRRMRRKKNRPAPVVCRGQGGGVRRFTRTIIRHVSSFLCRENIPGGARSGVPGRQWGGPYEAGHSATAVSRPQESGRCAGDVFGARLGREGGGVRTRRLPQCGLVFHGFHFSLCLHRAAPNRSARRAARDGFRPSCRTPAHPAVWPPNLRVGIAPLAGSARHRARFHPSPLSRVIPCSGSHRSAPAECFSEAGRG